MQQLDGIYAAGNGIDYPGKVKLISTGQGEALTAITNLNPHHCISWKKTEKFEHLLNT